MLAGVSAYLAFSATGDLSFYVQAAVGGPVWITQLNSPLLLAPALILTTIGLACLTRRRAVVFAAALPAAAAVWYDGPWRSGVLGVTVAPLVCLALLVALAGGDASSSRRWLWPVGLVAAAPLVPVIGPVLFVALLLTVGVVSIVWIVVDARPVIAMLVFVLALWLPATADNVAGALPFLVIVIVIALPAVLLLRRQSARTSPRGPA